jgi:hypothetical protein
VARFSSCRLRPGAHWFDPAPRGSIFEDVGRPLEVPHSNWWKKRSWRKGPWVVRFLVRRRPKANSLTASLNRNAASLGRTPTVDDFIDGLRGIQHLEDRQANAPHFWVNAVPLMRGRVVATDVVARPPLCRFHFEAVNIYTDGP